MELTFRGQCPTPYFASLCVVFFFPRENGRNTRVDDIVPIGADVGIASPVHGLPCFRVEDGNLTRPCFWCEIDLLL
jgi:hypothetical protein